jgi:hypothetical protein
VLPAAGRYNAPGEFVTHKQIFVPNYQLRRPMACYSCANTWKSGIDRALIAH